MTNTLFTWSTASNVHGLKRCHGFRFFIFLTFWISSTIPLASAQIVAIGPIIDEKDFQKCKAELREADVDSNERIDRSEFATYIPDLLSDYPLVINLAFNKNACTPKDRCLPSFQVCCAAGVTGTYIPITEAQGGSESYLFHVCTSASFAIQAALERLPTTIPSGSPSVFPSSTPTNHPTVMLSLLPSKVPSSTPSAVPSIDHSDTPSNAPSDTPSTLPSFDHSDAPSSAPTDTPTMVPSLDHSDAPSDIPTDAPTTVPSLDHSDTPSDVPTDTPTMIPSFDHTNVPSVVPTDLPTSLSSVFPSGVPTIVSTVVPSGVPTIVSSVVPSVLPTVDGSLVPSVMISETPSLAPSSVPTAVPTAIPTISPTERPSTSPPTSLPSATPTSVPTAVPSISHAPTRFGKLELSLTYGLRTLGLDATAILESTDGNTVSSDLIVAVTTIVEEILEDPDVEATYYPSHPVYHRAILPDVCDPLVEGQECVVVKSVVTVFLDRGGDPEETRTAVLTGVNSAIEDGSFFEAFP